MDRVELEQRIQAAIVAYDTGVESSLTAAAISYNVPISTTKHRYAGRKALLSNKLRQRTSQQLLSVAEEKAIVD